MNEVIKKSGLSAGWHLGAVVLVVVAAFSLGGASVALGGSPLPTCKEQSSAGDEYCKPAKVVAGTSGGNSGSGSYTPPSTGSASGGTLPFTGVSLIWPAIAAIVLVSLGLALRRHERTKS
jgi:hypothetical protein